MKTHLPRRTFLRGIGMGGAAIRIGLPSLAAMFNSSGTAYAAAADGATRDIEKRFVFWFNGNGIPEKYWIPRETGADFEFTPCLAPLERFRNDIHVVTGLDSPAARLPGPGNSHYPSMSALVSGQVYTGRGAGGPSFDQVIAAQDWRRLAFPFASDRRLPGIVRREHPAQSELGGSRPPAAAGNGSTSLVRPAVRRTRTGLDQSRSAAFSIPCVAKRRRSNRSSARKTSSALDEYLTSVRELERSIASLPPEYKQVVEQPPEGGDLKDWPRIAKLQSDLLAHALASHQTRVASYMLTKCQGLSRFPWLGHTAERHHEYTHGQVETPEGHADPAGHLPVACGRVRLSGGEAEIDAGRRRHAARPHLSAFRA